MERIVSLVLRCMYLPSGNIPSVRTGALTNILLRNRLLVCALYYYVWAKILPKWKGYALRQELVVLGGGAETHAILKVPLSQVVAWDADHDAVGKRRNRAENELQAGEGKAERSSSDLDTKHAAIKDTEVV